MLNNVNVYFLDAECLLDKNCNPLQLTNTDSSAIR